MYCTKYPPTVKLDYNELGFNELNDNDFSYNEHNVITN